jgi:probable HAF family extracellular repeat protein
MRAGLRVLSGISLCLLTVILFISRPLQAQSAYTIADLGALGGDAAAPNSINARGQVAGWAETQSSLPHAFIYDGARIQDLGSLGGSSSIAHSLNATGVVVGETALAGDSARHAFAHDGGQMRDLGTLGGSYSAAYGISPTGRVVGVSSTTGEAAYHAFVHDGARMQDLGTLGGAYSVGLGINATGQVVGWSHPTNSWLPHAFWYSSGMRMRDLGTLGGGASMAMAINDRGQIAGGAFPQNGNSYHAFLYEGGRMRDLGTLGGTYSFARALNAAGHLVGESLVAGDRAQRAFLYRDGTMRDLNSLIPPGSGWELTEATGINEAGQIVGVGTRGGQQRAVLLSPAVVSVPPPLPPAQLAARAVSAAQIDLSWTDNNGAETAFALWRKSPAADWSRVAVLEPNVTTYQDKGMAAQTVYTYRVCAMNQQVASPWSNEAAAETLPLPPAAPTQLALAVNAAGGVDLTWLDNSINETAFGVWRRVDAGEWRPVGQVGENQPRFSEGGLNPNDAYSYRVQALNAGGASGWSNEVSRTGLLGAPSGLYVRNGAPYLIRLEFTDNSAGESGFQLWRKVGDGEFQLLVALPTNQDYFTDYNVAPNTDYTYRVRAMSATGATAWSNEARFRTQNFY